jgi:endonuclease III
MTELSGSDIAYDIRIRRVFLRTGLAERDDVSHMVAVARALSPDPPGEPDDPADIGRRWCTAGNPDCPACPLLSVCPRYIERGSRVRGI